MPKPEDARDAGWLAPAWDGADGVRALMTTRRGGASRGAFESMNLRGGLGDDPAAVAANRRRFDAALQGAAPVWLDQVHGARVVRVGADDARRAARGIGGEGTSEGAAESADEGPALHRADASVATEPGVACVVQVADCLPVLFAAPRARGVAAAHAGWRGLAGGVLEATVHALCEAARCEPGELRAWLGACIGPGRFEVGADVLEAFGADPSRMPPPAGSPVPAAAFTAAADASGSPRFRPHAPGKWLADLPALARDRLRAAGVRDVDGGAWCTVEDASRFFSFRRDRVTGRMAAAVWIAPR